MSSNSGTGTWRCPRCQREMKPGEGVGCPSCHRVVCRQCTQSVGTGAHKRTYCRDCVVHIPEIPEGR